MVNLNLTYCIIMLNLTTTNKYSYNQYFKILIKLNLTLTQYVKFVSNKGINEALFNIKLDLKLKL